MFLLLKMMITNVLFYIYYTPCNFFLRNILINNIHIDIYTLDVVRPLTVLVRSNIVSFVSFFFNKHKLQAFFFKKKLALSL